MTKTIKTLNIDPCEIVDDVTLFDQFFEGNEDIEVMKMFQVFLDLMGTGQIKLTGLIAIDSDSDSDSEL